MWYAIHWSDNIRSRMKGHKSDYRRFLNGEFSKSDISALYSQIESHDVKILKFKIFEIFENDGFRHTRHSPI